MVAGDNRSIPTGSGDTVIQDICGQATGESGGVGGPTAYFGCLCKRDGLQGRAETPGAVVGAGGSGKSAEGQGRSNFSSGKGAVATGIRQAWQEQGRVGGGDHGE